MALKTPGEIIRTCDHCGCMDSCCWRCAEAAVRAEREACAQLVEQTASGPMWRNLRKKVAGMIRARGSE